MSSKTKPKETEKLIPRGINEKTDSESHLSENLTEEITEPKTVEEALQMIGGSGIYQKSILCIFLIQWFVTVILYVGPLYFSDPPQFYCKGGQICNQEQALKTGYCSQDNMVPSQYITMVDTFGMYCENAYLMDITESMMFIGPVLGNIFLSMLADNKGRKIAQNIAWIILTVGVLGITFFDHQYLLIVFTFIAGFGSSAGTYNMVIINEQCDEHFRQKASSLLLTSWGAFQILLVPIAKYIVDWRTVYTYFIVIPSILSVILNFFVRESPRFLMNRDLNRSINQMNSIARINNRPEIRSDLAKSNLQESIFLENGGQELRNYTYIDLFRYQSVRSITISCCLILMYLYMLYYTTEYSLGELKGDMYTTAYVVSMCETGSLIILTYFIEDLPRKKYQMITTVACMCVGGCFIVLEYVETPNIVISVLAGIIRIFNCAGEGIAYIYVEELFPTSVRALGVGLQMAFGFIGSALSPYVITFSELINVNPIAACSAFGIPIIFVTMWLKETQGKRLPNDIQEISQNRQRSMSSSGVYDHQLFDSQIQDETD